MFLAALPWTYWMALPLMIGTAVVLIGFALLYLKKVVEPHVLYMDALAAARAPGLAGPPGERGLPGAGRTAGQRAPASAGSR